MKNTALFLLISLLSVEGFADSIHTIQLQHRSAVSLIPIITPLLGESSAISGSGYKLFLRGSQQDLTNTQSLLKQLDLPLKQLVISVFHGTQRETEELSHQFAVIYGQGGANKSRSNRGLNIQFSTRNEKSITSDLPLYQLKILEGHSGYIETGQTIPELYKHAWVNRRGQVIVETEIDHREVNNGFDVLPRVHGNEVTLEISPYKSLVGNRFQSNSVKTEALSTRLTGNLGEWLEIAGQQADTSSKGRQSGIHYQTREQESSNIWVRADLVN